MHTPKKIEGGTQRLMNIGSHKQVSEFVRPLVEKTSKCKTFIWNEIKQ